MLNNDPYATLLPTLETVGILLRPRRILELGAGVYSTPALCNPTLFPDVEYVHSYESNQEWIEHAKRWIGRPVDHLHFISVSDTPLLEQLEEVDLDTYELIVIDNGVDPDERRDCIKFVADRTPAVPLVLIHDFEHLAYQRAADRFEHLLVDVHHYPQTALLWNGLRLSSQEERNLIDTVPLEKVY